MITKDELIKWAARHGYSKDKYNHYQRKTDEHVYRLNLSSIMARFESKLNLDGTNEWIRLWSGYYKDITITSEDKLAGLK